MLDTSRQLVHSEDTSELEDGQSDNVERFKKFLEIWRSMRPRIKVAIDISKLSADGHHLAIHGCGSPKLEPRPKTGRFLVERPE
jgi:hypothetical protein